MPIRRTMVAARRRGFELPAQWREGTSELVSGFRSTPAPWPNVGAPHDPSGLPGLCEAQNLLGSGALWLLWLPVTDSSTVRLLARTCRAGSKHAQGRASNG